MTHAFTYLFVCSLRNRLRQRVRRLRSPRYLVGFAAAALYLYTFIFRHAFAPGRSGETPFGVEAAVDPLAVIGPLLLWVIVTAAWLVPSADAAIPFTRAEVQFLFAAPVTRRQLLNYKLLKGQIGPLFGTAVTTLVIRPSSVARGWMFFAGLWLLLAILRMHLVGVALRRQSVRSHRAQGVKRHRIALGVVGGAALVVLATIGLNWTRLSETTSSVEFLDAMRRLTTTGITGWILWPFAAVARVPLARSPEAFVQALPAALAILALNYQWIARGDVAFEEASAAYAARQAASARSETTVRGDARRSPFTLGVTGRPEVALLWKNLMLSGRFASPRLLTVLVPLVVLVALILVSTGTAGVVQTVTVVSMALAAMTVFIGPQSVRNDLRQDLGHVALLKSWPVRGATLIRGELLAPTAVLSVTVWLLLLAAMILTTHPAVRDELPTRLFEHRLALAAGAAIAAPALIVTQLVLHNGLAVLFPAWVAIGSSRARGIDAMGQRLLMMAGVVLVLLVSILPAAIAAAPVVAINEIVTGNRALSIVGAAVVIAAVVLVESWLAIQYLGRVFERTDVSDIDSGDN